MAADEVDWDLNAVVRSFFTTTTAAATRTSTAVNCEDPLPCLAFRDGSQCQTSSGDPFGFEELLKPRSDGFDELQQLYRPYLNSSDNNSHKSSYGQIIQIQKQSCSMSMMNPPPPPPPPSTVVFPVGFCQPLPVQSPTPRSRKRKNQVKKAVCHVMAENLSSDLWAWRKYGQKPIKGSPFPRNYFRCSSSKGCGARKQVEQSTTDQNMFVVTYTGDHTHPRPTHRNSLAGSTRNKFINTLHKPTTGTAVSPTTPLTAEEPVLSMDDKEISDDIDEDNFVNGDDLLIPNLLGNNVADDFFMFGLQQEVNNNVSTASSDNFSSDRS